MEAVLRFDSRGVTLTGVLYSPPGDGAHPVVVWAHPSGSQPRLPYVQAADVVQAGVAVFSYDKRGVGESGGECCPQDFPLLADDLVAAVNAMKVRPEIDPARIGLFGVSQAGWVIPIAAASSPDVKFIAILSGPAVTIGEEIFYSQLTGENDCVDQGFTPEQISQRLAGLGPVGFDPAPYLRQITVPGLWLYGELDKDIPPAESAANLRRIAREEGRDFTIVTFPHANHAFQEVATGDCWEDTSNAALVPDYRPTLIRWIRDQAKIAE